MRGRRLSCSGIVVDSLSQMKGSFNGLLDILRFEISQQKRIGIGMPLVQPPILSELAVEVERVEVVPAGSGSIEDHFLISYT